jgi:hypothetical protein
MCFFRRFIFAALAGVAVAGAVTFWLTRVDESARSNPVTQVAQFPSRVPPPTSYPDPDLTTFPDPTAPPSSSAQVFVDRQLFDSLIGTVTAPFTENVSDQSSLDEYRQMIASRIPRVRAQLREKNSLVNLGPTPTADQALQAVSVYTQLAFVALYDGDHDETAAWFKKALALSRTPGVPTSVRAYNMALLGINALHRGEQDNCIGCVGPSCCIFPIAPEAVHTRPSGSREAAEWFSA